MSGWKDAKLLGRPEGKNEEEKNEGGLVIFIKDGPHGNEAEVGRIAFDRTEGSESDTPFNEQVDKVVEMARKSIATIHELHSAAGTLQ